jgi:acyl-CoA reductase-like NAD-dependent aldehyde dehydrogenase
VTLPIQTRDAIAREIAEFVRGGGLGDDGARSGSSLSARAVVAESAPPADSAVEARVRATVAAARRAAGALRGIDAETRRVALDKLRLAAVADSERLARIAHDETGLGRYEDKVVMATAAAERTPGVEYLEPNVLSRDGSYSRSRHSPYGVIASILPMTVPNEAIVSHTIAMVAGGNAVVFMPHPNAEQSTREAAELCSRVLAENGLPADAVTIVKEPSIDAAKALMRVEDVDLLVVTGGAAVVAQALRAPVRAICGGPGNTPVIVDDTANLAMAASCIFRGAAFDNTIGCVQEKEVFVQREIASELIGGLGAQGAYVASAAEVEALTQALVEQREPAGKASHVRKQFVGVDASKILAEIGVRSDARLVVCEVDDQHPFVWSEMLLPVLSVCPTGSWRESLDLAVRAERGFRHSSSIHSRSIERMRAYEDALDVAMMVRNAPSFAAVGVGSAQPFTVTLATRTGESSTTVRTFTRAHWISDALGVEEGTA